MPPMTDVEVCWMEHFWMREDPISVAASELIHSSFPPPKRSDSIKPSFSTTEEAHESFRMFYMHEGI